MSTIVDGFNSDYNDLITIELSSLEGGLIGEIGQSTIELKDIDLSSSCTITVQKLPGTTWPETIQVTTTPPNTIVISAISNCTVSGPTSITSPPQDTWTVTPTPGTTAFQLEISGKKQGNDWIDPKATVTVGEPPN